MKELVDYCIWGQEADYDLHVLTKINMIMHGDGWNNIKQGDSLRTNYLPEDSFQLVLENPPFTTPYTNKEVLNHYEMGHDKESQELDILFVEKSIRLLAPGGRMLIIIPEGLLNLPKYESFRVWLLSKVYVVAVCSLPAGSFQPFGRSASKTTILEVRKKGEAVLKPKYTFAAVAEHIGYETGKADYKEIPENDFHWILEQSQEYFTENKEFRGSKAGWVSFDLLNTNRIDAGGLLGANLRKDDSSTVELGDLFEIESNAEKLENTNLYNYVQVPYISDYTGALEKVDEVSGEDITSSSLNRIDPGSMYFTRINPRKRRIGIVPTILDSPIYISNEVYSFRYKDNPYIDEKDQYLIIPILRSSAVTKKIMMMATGSSSSRARISIDALRKLEISIPVLQRVLANGDSKQLLTQANNILQSVFDYQQLFTNNF